MTAAAEPRPSPWWPAPLVLLAAAVATHAAWLTRPLSVVFDEIYFGRFALAYLHHRYYFDLHPPLGKLIFGAMAALLGLDPGFGWGGNGLPFPDPAYALLRLPAHAAGVLLPLVFYGVALELGISRRSAFVVGALAVLDNAWLVMSRLTMIDIFFVLFGFAALWTYLRWRRHGGTPWFVAAATLAGLSLSVKWTGLSFLGLIVMLEVARLWRHREAVALARLATLFVLPAALYVGSFALHFALLDRAGDGSTMMSPAFQATLTGSPLAADPKQAKAGFVDKFVELNELMFRTSRNMTARHAYASKWYDWPFMMRTLDFWAEYHEPLRSRIYLLGNPVVWWASAYCMVFLLVNLVPKLPPLLMRTQPPAAPMAELFLIAAFLANMLPFTQIRRVMFVYHYLPALGFALLSLGLLLDRCGRHARWLSATLLALAAAAFVYFAPLSYGLPLTEPQFDARFWVESWK